MGMVQYLAPILSMINDTYSKGLKPHPKRWYLEKYKRIKSGKSKFPQKTKEKIIEYVESNNWHKEGN